MSDQTTIQKLENRVAELESELALRDKDLSIYKNELSHLNAKLEKLIDRLNKEIKIGHAIHDLLVPKEIPHIQGFEFSSKYLASPISGGDYFEIFNLEDKMRFGILLASSSGFGMSAIFLSVLLKLTSQMEARKGAAPNALLDSMAKEMQSQLSPEDNASVFYTVIDRRNLQMDYASAGHLACFLLQHTSQKLISLQNNSQPFSAQKNDATKLSTNNLSSRDKLIFCSRGILDATNTKGEKYGEERLAQLLLGNTNLGVHEMRNEILFQIEKYTKGAEAERDRTVIIADVKDRVIKLAKN